MATTLISPPVAAPLISPRADFSLPNPPPPTTTTTSTTTTKHSPARFRQSVAQAHPVASEALTVACCRCRT